MPKTILISKQIFDQKHKLFALQVSQTLQEWHPLQFGPPLESQAEQIQQEEAKLLLLEERQVWLEQQITHAKSMIRGGNFISEEKVLTSMETDAALEFIAQMIFENEEDFAKIDAQIYMRFKFLNNDRDTSLDPINFESNNPQNQVKHPLGIEKKSLESRLLELKKLQEKLEMHRDEKKSLGADDIESHISRNSRSDNGESSFNNESSSGIDEGHESNSGHINGRNWINFEMTDVEASTEKFETDIHFNEASSNAFSSAMDIHSSQNTPILTEIPPQESTPTIVGSPYQQFDYQE